MSLCVALICEDKRNGEALKCDEPEMEKMLNDTCSLFCILVLFGTEQQLEAE